MLEGDDAEHEVTIALDPHDDEPPAAEVSDVRVAKRVLPSATAPAELGAPVSPGASVERAQDAIVIRFPSVRPATAAPANRQATAPPHATPPPATAVPPREPDGDIGRSTEPEPQTTPTAPGGQPIGGEETGRRRRRRRRGRGRGNREGGESTPPATGARPAPTADRSSESRHDQRHVRGRPPQAAGGRDSTDADSLQGLSPSQKRRLRRRRRQQMRQEGMPGDAPVASPNAAIEAMKAEIARDNAAEEQRRAEEVAARASSTELTALPFEAEVDSEELFEARDVLEHAEAEADAGPTEAPSEPPAAERPGGAGERRRGRDRGRRGFRRRRDYGESNEADSRVWGEETESEAVEIVPDEAPGGVESLAEEAAAAPADTAGKRPAKRKEMIINIAPNEECRIAILEDGKLEQIYLERASAESHVGNIYKGVVTNVEPSIQAAFIDFGLGKNGFLHISDLHPKFFPNGENSTENVGRKLPRKARPPIQKCLRRGQEVIVQITKEGIGTKGPTLTTYLSIPGRFLVMMPGMRQLGVSRKIEDEELRRKLRAQMNDLELPDDIGFIARTAAEDRTTKELQSDLNYLTRLWRAVEKRIKSEPAPAELYRDSDLVIRTIRDVFASDVHRVIVDDPDVANRAAEFLAIFSPKARDTVVTYAEQEPIFHKYGIEAELERLHSRHVPLRSGGSLVIDQTEALVAIDVNSGRFRQEDDAELTAYKINCDAADEIPRQLRLRDLGGVIICDFIDMRREEHRREIEKRLIRNLKQHKERAKVLRISQFGIIEMTRQRQRASLTRSVYQDCHHCRGTGLVKTSESVALDVMRLIQLAVTREHIRSIEVAVSPEVSYLLQNRKRAALHQIETKYGRTVSIKPESGYSLDYVQINCYDNRGRLVPHP